MSAAPVPPLPSLTSAQRAGWERDGFLVLPGFAAKEACDALMARARALVDAFDPGEGAASIFSTTDQGRTSDAYFLGSGDQIRFFFEEGALDAGGALRLSRDLALNKIGHALHDLDPVFDAFSRTPALATLAAGLGMMDPVLLQSMYIFKQPHIGGEVVCLQDSTFLYTEPHSVTGFWFALEDATLENGCMWALPGGHRAGLKSRFVRAEDGRVRFVVLDATPWPAFGRENGYVPLEAPKGTAWWCWTGSAPTSPAPTPRADPGTPTPCTPSSAPRVTRRTTGSSAARAVGPAYEVSAELRARRRRPYTLRPVGLLDPTPPPYDPLVWAKKPFAERARMVCEAWAMQGYGTPPAPSTSTPSSSPSTSPAGSPSERLARR